MGLCDIARVIGSTLLDIGWLSDLFANNQLLNQTLEPAVAYALLHRNISNWRRHASLSFPLRIYVVSCIHEFFHHVLGHLRLI